MNDLDFIYESRVFAKSNKCSKKSSSIILGLCDRLSKLTPWPTSDFCCCIPEVKEEHYRITGNSWITDRVIKELFHTKCNKCGSRSMRLNLVVTGNSYSMECTKCNYYFEVIIG